MKNLILILTIAFLSLSVNAQKIENYKVRCISSRINDVDTVTNWVDSDTTFLLTIDLTKSTFEFNSNIPIKFYATETLKLKKPKGVDDEGDEYKIASWFGYDNTGKSCILTSIDYVKLDYRNFELVYNREEYFFETVILGKVKN